MLRLNLLRLTPFQIAPPFKPQVMSETDTRYFDIEFTDASVELTPPDDADAPSEAWPLSEADEDFTFSHFSYQVQIDHDLEPRPARLG